MALITSSTCVVLIPTFSPQGDGNVTCYVITLTYLCVDPYLFPARGRKPQNFFWDLPLRIYVDPYLFPARGRKLERSE